MSVTEGNLWLSDATHPYMYIALRKHIRKFQKNLKFWDVKLGCPLYTCIQFRGESLHVVMSVERINKIRVEKNGCNVCWTIIPAPAPIPHENEHGCTIGTKVSYQKNSGFF